MVRSTPNRFRMMALTFAATVVTLAMAPAAQASTQFDLFGHGGSQSSYTFNKDGITLNAYGTAEDYNGEIYTSAHGVKVHQRSYWNKYGLGVDHNHSDGDQSVDSNGWQDTLWLAFSETVQILDVTFTGTSDWDEIDVLDAGGIKLTEIEPDANWWGYAKEDVSDVTPALEGQLFGFTPGEYCDDFWLKKINVKEVDTPVVPTPGAASAGLALLGFVVLRRRQRVA